MSTLTCPTCGNSRGWRNARMDDDEMTATCAECGTTVTSQGGTRMDTVTDMTMTSRRGKKSR